MDTIERIRAEVERLRDLKGISFNEMVCYSNVLRIIEREYRAETLKRWQLGALIREPQYKIDLGRIYTNER